MPADRNLSFRSIAFDEAISQRVLSSVQQTDRSRFDPLPQMKSTVIHTAVSNSLNDFRLNIGQRQAWIIFAPIDFVLPTYGQGKTWLSPEEWRRIERLKFERDRQRRLGAYILQRFLLAHALDLDPASFRFEWRSSGKPCLLGDYDADINLSHSAEWLAAGVSTHGCVGVDIESDERQADWRALAPFFLHPEERTLSEGMTDAELRAFYLERWSLKEAFAKATGLGFSIEPETLLPDKCEEGWSLSYGNCKLVAATVQPGPGVFGLLLRFHPFARRK
jgi:phosphopantetheinyl transferase